MGVMDVISNPRAQPGYIFSLYDYVYKITKDIWQWRERQEEMSDMQHRKKTVTLNLTCRTTKCANTTGSHDVIKG